MNFAESEELLQLREMAHRFARAEVAPQVRTWDREERFPREFNARVAEIGLLGGVLPERLGGSGMTYLQMTVVLEELAYFCPMAAMVCGHPSYSLGTGLSMYGTEQLAEKYLGPTLRGELIGAAAVTESQSGTDIVRRMETTVRREDDHYVLNGRKVWISNLENADWFLTFGTIDKSRSHRGVCAFIVEKSYPGVSITPYHDKVGARTFASGDVVLDDVRVPATNLIGAEGEGYRVLLAGTEIGRLACAARAVGQIRACLDLATRYAQDRVVYDQPIGRYQLVQQKIADMAVDLETSRLLTYKLAWLTDQGHRRLQKEAAIAKLHATDGLMRAATETMQIHGAYSCSDEYEIGRIWRDAKFTQIYDGANEIQRVMIAEHELGYRSN